MPLLQPFCTAYGDTAVIESVFVSLACGGVEGWGEATPWASPVYSSEWAGGVFLVLRDWLAPRVLGQQLQTPEQLQEKLAGFRGNYFAKAALDLAWWDLHARVSATPLWKLLGGSCASTEVGADFGVMESLDALKTTVGAAITAGFKRIKLKFRPGWDLDMLRAVRASFPNTVFHIDCNGAYRLRNLAMFQALDELNMAMIEQPLAWDDLWEHARLQEKIKTPICLDESITSVERAAQAIEMGACRWINVKLGRVGGITPAREIIALAARAGIPCWIGGMLESAIGASHSLALATLPNICYPSDVFPSRRFYAKDLGQPEIELSAASTITALDQPGIGCTPDTCRLFALTIESCQLGGAHKSKEKDR